MSSRSRQGALGGSPSVGGSVALLRCFQNLSGALTGSSDPRGIVAYATACRTGSNSVVQNSRYATGSTRTAHSRMSDHALVRASSMEAPPSLTDFALLMARAASSHPLRSVGNIALISSCERPSSVLHHAELA